MEISSMLSAVDRTAAPLEAHKANKAKKADELADASKQFESILLRQFLGESMKGLLDGGESGQVYGYLMTDSLANSLSAGGGLGLSSVLQAQLGGAKL
jgi:peptidoglycan hydrolase FlgJ